MDRKEIIKTCKQERAVNQFIQVMSESHYHEDISTDRLTRAVGDFREILYISNIPTYKIDLSSTTINYLLGELYRRYEHNKALERYNIDMIEYACDVVNNSIENGMVTIDSAFLLDSILISDPLKEVLTTDYSGETKEYNIKRKTNQ